MAAKTWRRKVRGRRQSWGPTRLSPKSHLYDQPRCRRLQLVGAVVGMVAHLSELGVTSPVAFFLLSFPCLTSSFSYTRCPLPSSFFAPVVFLSPSACCPPCRLVCLHSVSPYILLFCAIVAPYFLVFCPRCPPSLPIAPLPSVFALAVPLSPSLRREGGSSSKTGQKCKRKESKGAVSAETEGSEEGNECNKNRKAGGQRMQKTEGGRGTASAETGGREA